MTSLTATDALLIGITLLTVLLLNTPAMRHNRLWSVTITPLASIIGSSGDT